MVKLQLSSLDELFRKITESGKLYLPVDTEEGARYLPYAEGLTLSRATNTTRSAKDFFFPQVENIVNFKVDGKKIEIEDIREELEDFVIFGVRACDIASFEVLDRVYLTMPPVDTFYKNRRDHATIVSLACENPQETCFCSVFNGVDAANPKGDVSAWIKDDFIYFNANTEKGNAFVDKIASLTSDSDESEVNAAKDALKSKLEKLPIKDIKLDKISGRGLMENFNSSVWSTMYESCLGCGTCTFVCPTCQCFDVREFDTGHGIQRFRCWDSCMYKDFTKMAAGNNRMSQKERFRQRFMHKLVYYPENNEGIYMCVGCGRCLKSCPINMNIVKVAKALGGEN